MNKEMEPRPLGSGKTEPLPTGRGSVEESPSLSQGRFCLVLAAVLWSSSGAFTKLLTQETGFGLNEPPVCGELIAFFRVLFGALVLLPLLRPRYVAFRLGMIGAGICFAVMNVLFVKAMAEGTSANAILLQYTAPMWMYVVSVGVLGERADRRAAVALVIGLAGIGLIIAGAPGGDLPVVAIALGSGVAYAGVLLWLRVLRGLSSLWLTVFNLLFSGLTLLPVLWWFPRPTGPQLAVLVIYGALQLALPYWLVARGLRAVSPQEAGTLTLLEPLLNPLWAYLISPGTESLSSWTLAGGACIIGALGYRYWPWRAGSR
jgi:drug/metabolite transporter (DMT)-like permease